MKRSGLAVSLLSVCLVSLGFVLILGGTGCGSSNNNSPSAPASAPSGPTYAYTLTIGDTGKMGSGNGQFFVPIGVAIYANSLFVVDSSNRRIEKFDLNGNFLSSFTGNGFNFPYGIAIDKNGILYVADGSNNNIQKIDFNGNYLSTLGSTGAGLGYFNFPRGIAVDSQSNIYVADSGNARLEKCSSTGSNCVTVGGGAFLDVALDGSGNVWATNDTTTKICEFTSGLTPVTSFGTNGTAAGDLSLPFGIAVGTDGSLLVSDLNLYWVQRFSTSGTYLGQVGVQGPGVGIGQFANPGFIAVDSLGHAYISDLQNETVMKF